MQSLLQIATRILEDCSPNVLVSDWYLVYICLVMNTVDSFVTSVRAEIDIHSDLYVRLYVIYTGLCRWYITFSTIQRLDFTLQTGFKNTKRMEHNVETSPI